MALAVKKLGLSENQRISMCEAKVDKLQEHTKNGKRQH